MAKAGVHIASLDNDKDDVTKIVPEADAKLLGGPIYNAASPSGNGMQTRTFRLPNIPAARVYAFTAKLWEDAE